jgi:DNA-binding GntR family transcriptional regulator
MAVDGHADLSVTGSVEGYSLGRPAAATKADRAYQQIRGDIIEGRLPAGMPLDQEAIAVAQGLSTTPVREALNRLEAEGLVIIRAHRQTVVAPVSVEAVADTYAVRLELDPLAAGLAATHASEEEAARILALARREPERDPVAALHGNRRLHRAIYAASGNAVLIRILDMLWDSSDRYRLMLLNAAETMEVAHDQHLAIAMAIVERDSERAAALTREHNASSFRRIREVPLTE